MGNNAAFTQFEATVILLYDQGVLTLPVLDGIAEQYRGTDIDSGGRRGLLTKDNKDIAEVCITIVDPDFTSEDDDGWYWKWYEIRSRRWGWI